ncbi:MAG: YncE family protein [Flavobacteriaceae bacterium]|nr:YncE family protein [Flavobacteriaceae bacterium]
MKTIKTIKTMKPMKTISKVFLLIIMSVMLSCSSDSDDDPIPQGDYVNGYFIVNEGNFATGIGTLSFVNNDGTVVPDVYQTVNSEPMGNTLQSMYFYNDNAYLVLNGSHKIIVTNRYTMEKIATIEGTEINNPRFFVAIDNKGYVSNWGDGTDATDDFITVINLETNTVESTIPIGEGPEKMLINDAKLYVNLKGGFNQNNQVVIIDTTNNTEMSSLTVGGVPNSIEIDKNNDIWVLCRGNYAGTDTAGRLVRIKDDAVFVNFDFGMTEHPEHLSINTAKDVFYYNLNGKVFSQSIVTSPSEEISGFDGSYYGMTIKEDKLYTLNAGNFTSEGILKIFDLNTDETQTITTGIIPNFVVFQ